MGPDWYWVAVFSLGGIAMGLTTTFVGLPKGRDVALWWVLYAFFISAATLLGIEAPFLTVLIAVILASLMAGLMAAIFLDRYRRSNPWFQDPDHSRRWIQGSLVGFALFAGILFGLVTASAAWALSLL